MRRRDIGLAFAAGLLPVLLAVLDPETHGLLIGYVLGPAVTFWYVGVGAIVLALVLRWRRLQPQTVAIAGFVGIAWTTCAVGAVAWLLLALATMGPIGP